MSPQPLSILLTKNPLFYRKCFPLNGCWMVFDIAHYWMGTHLLSASSPENQPTLYPPLPPSLLTLGKGSFEITWLLFYQSSVLCPVSSPSPSHGSFCSSNISHFPLTALSIPILSTMHLETAVCIHGFYLPSLPSHHPPSGFACFLLINSNGHFSILTWPDLVTLLHEILYILPLMPQPCSSYSPNQAPLPLSFP